MPVQIDIRCKSIELRTSTCSRIFWTSDMLLCIMKLSEYLMFPQWVASNTSRQVQGPVHACIETMLCATLDGHSPPIS